MYNKYPYTDFSELNLDWFLEEFKKLKEDWETTSGQWDQMQLNFQTLEGTVQTFTTFVENYFENLDVQQEINNKLDELVADGTLSTLLAPLVDDKLPDVVDSKLPAELATQLPGEVTTQLPGVVATQIDAAVATPAATATTAWLTANVDPVGSAVTIDSSLTIAGSAADAKVVGDDITITDGSVSSLIDGFIGVIDNTSDDVILKISVDTHYGAFHNSPSDTSQKSCSSDPMALRDMTISFDDTKYKFLLNKYNSNTQTWSTGSWITTSPYTITYAGQSGGGVYTQIVLELNKLDNTNITSLKNILVIDAKYNNGIKDIFANIADRQDGSDENIYNIASRKYIYFGNYEATSYGAFHNSPSDTTQSSCHTAEIPIDTMIVSFDSTKYKLILNRYNATTQTWSTGSWITTSPYTINSVSMRSGDTYSKMVIEMQDLSLNVIKNKDSVMYIDRIYSTPDGYVYIDPNGDDTNDGTDPDHPVKTFARAFSLGNHVKAKRGTYDSVIGIQDRIGVSVTPLDNDQTYAHTDPVRDKIVIQGTSSKPYLCRIINCEDVYLEDIIFDTAANDVVSITKSNNVTLQNCEAHNSVNSMGFYVSNSDVIMKNCIATGNRYDGFNFHNYGTSIMYDCISDSNTDDGCSHHDGCIGTIYGGIFTGNGKCGIAPAYGARVNIYDAVCDSNRIGIGYLSTNNGHASMIGVISSCVMVDNSDYGLEVDSLCTVTSINCKYSGNSTDKQVTGTLNEY